MDSCESAHGVANAHVGNGAAGAASDAGAPPKYVKLTYATSASRARSAAISRSTSAVVATAKRSTLASRQSTSVLRAAAVRGKMASCLS